MKMSDYIGIGLLGLGAYAIYKLTTERTSTVTVDRYINEEYGIKEAEASALDPGKQLIRKIGSDGSITTYKTDSLPWYQRKALEQGNYRIEDDTFKVSSESVLMTALKNSPLTALPTRLWEAFK
jgi:hypothetical protein